MFTWKKEKPTMMEKINQLKHLKQNEWTQKIHQIVKHNKIDAFTFIVVHNAQRTIQHLMIAALRFAFSFHLLLHLYMCQIFFCSKKKNIEDMNSTWNAISTNTMLSMPLSRHTSFFFRLKHTVRSHSHTQYLFQLAHKWNNVLHSPSDRKHAFLFFFIFFSSSVYCFIPFFDFLLASSI